MTDRPTEGKPLRRGWTTGSCAAAAARAAARLLFAGEAAEAVRLRTPGGAVLTLPVETLERRGDTASCGVRKDAGDDPDVTHGLVVFADLSVRERGGEGLRLTLTGGEGVGTVTLPGLEQPVGEAAINRVPRRMIQEGIREEAERAGFAGAVSASVRVPGGEAAAERTFNPRLGIVGGISILGTTGIVEPMSESAFTATIRAELSVLAAAGEQGVILTPGNYGRDFLREMEAVPDRLAVKCGNFLGEALRMAAELGFRRVLIAGHLGKLVKLAGGMLNTHSRYGDCRMELLCAHAALAGAGQEVARGVMASATTVQGAGVLAEAGLLEATMASLAARIEETVSRRAGPGVAAGVMAYLPGAGVVLATSRAPALLAELCGGVPRKTGCPDFSQGDCKEKSAGNPSIFDTTKRPSPVEKDGCSGFWDTPKEEEEGR